MAYIDSAKRVDWLSGPNQAAWATEILGSVDLDPCGHPDQIVPATTVLCGEGIPGDEDDGMTADWVSHGRIYINPTWGIRPPASGAPECFYPISKWTSKMTAEGARGASILFVGPASTGARWFHKAAETCQSFCLLSGRIKFRLPETSEVVRKKSAPGQDNISMLWTPDVEIYHRYLKVMNTCGIVVEVNPVVSGT